MLLKLVLPVIDAAGAIDCQNKGDINTGIEFLGGCSRGKGEERQRQTQRLSATTHFQPRFALGCHNMICPSATSTFRRPASTPPNLLSGCRRA